MMQPEPSAQALTLTPAPAPAPTPMHAFRDPQAQAAPAREPISVHEPRLARRVRRPPAAVGPTAAAQGGLSSNREPIPRLLDHRFHVPRQPRAAQHDARGPCAPLDANVLLRGKPSTGRDDPRAIRILAADVRPVCCRRRRGGAAEHLPHRRPRVGELWAVLASHRASGSVGSAAESALSLTSTRSNTPLVHSCILLLVCP